MWVLCFEAAGDDIAESVTQEFLGDYIVAVKLAKHWQFFGWRCSQTDCRHIPQGVATRIRAVGTVPVNQVARINAVGLDGLAARTGNTANQKNNTA